MKSIFLHEKNRSHLHGVGEAEIQGAGLVREILNYIFIKKTVLVVGEDLVYFSD